MILKETKFRSFSVKVPLFTKRLWDLLRIVQKIVPRQMAQWPNGSHNKQLNLTYRKKITGFGFPWLRDGLLWKITWNQNSSSSERYSSFTTSLALAADARLGGLFLGITVLLAGSVSLDPDEEPSKFRNNVIIQDQMSFLSLIKLVKYPRNTCTIWVQIKIYTGWPVWSWTRFCRLHIWSYV